MPRLVYTIKIKASTIWPHAVAYDDCRDKTAYLNGYLLFK